MLRALLVLSLTLAFGVELKPGPVAAQQFAPSSPPTLWHHNGSIVMLVARGASREFYYERPRRGMLDAGARPGTLLFQGVATGHRYEGVAFIFNARCGRYPYQVAGPIVEGYRRVILRGLAPKVNRHCEVISYVPDILDFQLIDD